MLNLLLWKPVPVDDRKQAGYVMISGFGEGIADDKWNKSQHEQWGFDPWHGKPAPMCKGLNGKYTATGKEWSKKPMYERFSASLGTLTLRAGNHCKSLK